VLYVEIMSTPKRGTAAQCSINIMTPPLVSLSQLRWFNVIRIGQREEERCGISDVLTVTGPAGRCVSSQEITTHRSKNGESGTLVVT